MARYTAYGSDIGQQTGALTLKRLLHLARLVWGEFTALNRIVIFTPVVLGTLSQWFDVARLAAVGTYASITLAVLWVIWTLAGLTLRYEEELKPKVALDIIAPGCIVVTPQKIKDVTTGETIREYQALYVRFVVEVLSAHAVPDCMAYLVDVQRYDDDGGKLVNLGFLDPIPLPWSNVGVEPFRIPSQIGWYVDVLMTDSEASLLQVASRYPLTMRGMFAKPGNYRCRVLVSSGDGNTSTLEFDVGWSGKWDSVAVGPTREDSMS